MEEVPSTRGGIGVGFRVAAGGAACLGGVKGAADDAGAGVVVAAGLAALLSFADFTGSLGVFAAVAGWVVDDEGSSKSLLYSASSAPYRSKMLTVRRRQP